MKRYVVAAAAGFIVWGACLANEASAELNINIGINLPPAIVVSSAPEVVVIPGTYVYFAPGVPNDLFFYRGHWWRPHKGRWYRADDTGGPWIYVELGSVPGVLIKLPPSYRDVPPGHERIPYGQVKKNWKQWEDERHWEKSGKRHKEEHKEHRHKDKEHRKGKGHD